MTSNWQASGFTTLVGSMPHRDRDQAIDLILRASPDIPVWPQLPAFGPEQMMLQFLEGLPGMDRDSGGNTLRTDTPEFEQEVVAFYEDALRLEEDSSGLNTSRFAMGGETAGTFFRFLEALEKRDSSTLYAVKGQVVGPFTLLSGLKDHQGRALLFDERMHDVVVRHLSWKARWQIERLRAFGRPVILFLDEPALAGFGSSAFISISYDLVQQLLKEVVESIHGAGALAGIHICANTDWMLAFDSKADIINLDAFNYMDKFALYREAFERFITEGRTIAWGLIPTSDAALVDTVTPQGLAQFWFEHIQEFITPELSAERILAQSLFTPSCGCGGLREPAAEKVLIITKELGKIMRQHL